MTWIKLNDDGEVIEEVEFAYSNETGKVLLGYSKNGVGVSSWHNETFATQPYRPQFDFYLASNVDGTQRSNQKYDILIENGDFHGMPGSKVDFLREFSDQDKLMMSKQITASVAGELFRYWYDMSTGQVIQMEYYYVNEDQSLILNARTENIVIKFGLLPQAKSTRYWIRRCPDENRK